MKTVFKSVISSVAIATALLLFSQVQAQSDIQWDAKGLVRLQYVSTDGTDSWLNRGTGQLRFDDGSGFELGQALVELSADFGSGLSAKAVLNHYQDPEATTGLTQAYLRYQPVLSPNYRLRLKAGLFYPEMSYENPGTGWTSPYSYSFSAINAWVAEEMRVPGIEAKLDFTRRQSKSPHKFALIGALYKGNDTLGTMLAWRGWGVHDRQSVANETVLFARYPSIGPGARVERQAAWVEPFRELDGRWGHYLGAEWNYKQKSRVRFYHYDNNGDYKAPWRDGGQKIWDTQFQSIAWQYRFDRNWRLLSQYMDGKTRLGARVVKIDFTAWYAMLNYRANGHSASARIDVFETVDRDDWATDLNDGDGSAFTVNYQYQYDKNWSFGAEYTYLDGERINREQWPGRDAELEQKQITLAAQYRF